MRDSPTSIKEFCILLELQAIRKAQLYDGVESDTSVDRRLALATEELGEVASAVTRSRLLLAKAECLDLAHCGMLLWFAIKKVLEEGE